MENYSQELNDTLNEAMNVRIELESMMENAIQISQTFVDKYEEKISRFPEISTQPEIITQPTVPDFAQEERIIAPVVNMVSTETKEDNELLVKLPKTRVHELASELQMSSKELIQLIRSLGIQVNSHMNALDDKQLTLIKQAMNANLNTEQESRIIEPTPINLQDLNQPEPKGSLLDLIVDNECLNNEINGDFSLNETKSRQLEAQPLQGLEFSMDELKKAHPYLAVKTMYDHGYPIWEIAKLLGRGQGEVSLILNLAKKKTAVI